MNALNPQQANSSEDVSRCPDHGQVVEDAWRQRISEALRTRLNAIIGFAGLLALEQLSAAGRNDLKQLLKSAHDLLDVVEHELASPDKSQTNGATANRPQSKTCDLLYIEDDIANFTLVERILELRPGVSLKHAIQGRRGIEIAKSENPRLILLDLNLPDIHGAEVLSTLQTCPDTSHIPVVVLSANAIPTQIERLLEAGARNYLTKPFGLDEFLAVIDEWTGTGNSIVPRAAVSNLV